jgi:hypothetical protein
MATLELHWLPLPYLNLSLITYLAGEPWQYVSRRDTTWVKDEDINIIIISKTSVYSQRCSRLSDRHAEAGTTIVTHTKHPKKKQGPQSHNSQPQHKTQYLTRTLQSQISASEGKYNEGSCSQGEGE